MEEISDIIKNFTLKFNETLKLYIFSPKKSAWDIRLLLNKKVSSAFAISIFLLSIITITTPVSASSSLTPHVPIIIVGNAGFTPANGVTEGSGTVDDPYIIENWDIDATTAHGILIINTDAYFIIRKCYIHDGGSNHGIWLFNVQNGKVKYSIVTTNYDGIYLLNSYYNELSYNKVHENNHNGIRLYNSHYNELSYNRVYENNFGIVLWSSNYNESSYNKVCENNNFGIVLSSSDYNRLIWNSVIRNNDYGIAISSSSNYNKIIRNIAWLNSVFDLFDDGTGTGNVWKWNLSFTENF